MKIVLNIEKKHLIFLSIFLVLVGSVFVIATNWEEWESSKPYHEILYTSIIGPKDDTVEVILRTEVNEADPNKYKIWSPHPNLLKYGTRTTKNIFTGEICSDNQINNCKDVSEIISGASDEGIEFTTPIKRDWYNLDNLQYYIAGREIEAIEFCSKETGGEMIDFRKSNNCPENDYLVKGQNWRPFPCNNEIGILTYVKCIGSEEPEEVFFLNSEDGREYKISRGNWEKTCPEDKNLIGFKSIGTNLYLVCK